MSGSMATLDDFKKLDLRVAEILEVEPHPDADRLYILKIQVGDTQKQIVAGIKQFYDAADLKGKRIAVIDNLDLFDKVRPAARRKSHHKAVKPPYSCPPVNNRNVMLEKA